MIEVDRRAALQRRQPFGAEAEEGARAEAVVVEIRAEAAARGPAVAPAVLRAAAEDVRVNAVAEVLELVAADAEVDRRRLARPLLALEVDALEREIVGIGRVAVAPLEVGARAQMPRQIELLPRRHVPGVEGDRIVLRGDGMIVPAVPAINLADVVVGLRRDVLIELAARIVGQVRYRAERMQCVRIIGI